MTAQGSAGPVPALPTGIEEHALFRSLFVAYPDALLLVDQAGNIVLANPAAAKLLGYAVDELVRLNVDTLVPDATRPRHAAYRTHYARAPRARPMGTEMALVARRKDGSEVMVEIALSPLTDSSVPLVVAAIRGIGAYPRVQQALRRAHYSEMLAQFGRMVVDTREPQWLLDRVPAIAAEALQVEVAMVYLLEPDQLTLRVAGGLGMVPGEEIAARLPYRRDTSPGLVLSEGRPLVVADYRSEQRFVVPKAYLDAGLVSGLAVPLSDRGRAIGALAVRSRSAMDFGEEETRFLGSLANLLATALQRLQTEEALNHAQRLESVGQLTGGIAHDFNNLLTVIQGNLQVLEDLPPLAHAGDRQPLIDAATRATRRATELTAKLLAFSRRQVLQPTAVEVGTLLQSLATMLRRTLDQHIEIEVHIPSTPLNVLADPGQLDAALLNIAINARDAMPEGGRIGFRAQVCSTLPSGVRSDLDAADLPDDRYVSIAITDSGRGMSELVKERAFEPFFTTKELGRGTGLGLSTVYGFVKQSRGAVAIDTAPGAGTTLTLYLPRPAEATQADAEAEADAGSADSAVPVGLRVLLVEDEAEVRKVLFSFLAKLGCDVTTAANAEQALLALALAPDARFDLLLTDIALGPGLRGTQLAAEAQRRFPLLAILLMSGYSAELLDADRDSPSSWELLRKPCSRQDLARAIAKLLAPPGYGAAGSTDEPPTPH